MKGKHRNHTAQFKAQVALAAVKGDRSMAELTSQYEVHPSPYPSVIFQVFLV